MLVKFFSFMRTRIVADSAQNDNIILAACERWKS